MKNDKDSLFNPTGPLFSEHEPKKNRFITVVKYVLFFGVLVLLIAGALVFGLISNKNRQEKQKTSIKSIIVKEYKHKNHSYLFMRDDAVKDHKIIMHDPACECKKGKNE